jgi:excisionase family DNA binding protein
VSSLSRSGDGVAPLLNVQGVADILNCSTRHVRRLADASRMPAPLKLGVLVRWDRRAIEEWVRNGCPNCRKAAKGANR